MAHTFVILQFARLQSNLKKKIDLFYYSTCSRYNTLELRILYCNNAEKVMES